MSYTRGIATDWTRWGVLPGWIYTRGIGLGLSLPDARTGQVSNPVCWLTARGSTADAGVSFTLRGVS